MIIIYFIYTPAESDTASQSGHALFDDVDSVSGEVCAKK